MSKHKIEINQALVAMIIWEEMLNYFGPIKDADNGFALMKEEIGVSEMRDEVLRDLAPAVELSWYAVSGSFDEPFDFEFVPEFLERIEPLIKLKGTLSIDQVLATSIGEEILQSRES